MDSTGTDFTLGVEPYPRQTVVDTRMFFGSGVFSMPDWLMA